MKEWTTPKVESLRVNETADPTTNNGQGWGAGGVHNYNGQGNGQHNGVDNNNGLHNGWKDCIS